jgi:MFS family permease
LAPQTQNQPQKKVPACAPEQHQPSAAAINKAARRLIPFLFLLYVLAHIDRGNIPFAKSHLDAALGFGDAVYSFGIGVFYLGYCVFEVPSNLILARVGARRWLGRIMVTWGAVCAAMMLMRHESHFYWLRFLLGVAEAGFFPGVILYLTYWFPSARRAETSALFLRVFGRMCG